LSNESIIPHWTWLSLVAVIEYGVLPILYSLGLGFISNIETPFISVILTSKSLWVSFIVALASSIEELLVLSKMFYVLW